jgi:hypothetical protein
LDRGQIEFAPLCIETVQKRFVVAVDFCGEANELWRLCEFEKFFLGENEAIVIIELDETSAVGEAPDSLKKEASQERDALSGGFEFIVSRCEVG